MRNPASCHSVTSTNQERRTLKPKTLIENEKQQNSSQHESLGFNKETIKYERKFVKSLRKHVGKNASGFIKQKNIVT